MPSLTSSLPFSPAELAYLHTSLSSIPPIRPDARASATDFRPLRAETGVLPSVNGSAHVGFSDGREAIVGVKLEVEKTVQNTTQYVTEPDAEDGGGAMDIDETITATAKGKGRQEWTTLSLTLPGLRDDDANLVFLEEMLREPLIVGGGLQDTLVINARWHWHIYIDVLLISPNGLASYPLPLLSTAMHIALRDTRVPRLKSEGEEDPVADDDWMASTYLYLRSGERKPPVTLLVVVVGENVIFDPSREELVVADAVVAVSVSQSEGEEMRVLAVRMIDTPARDTMKGVPQAGEAGEGVDVPGVWKPRVGGVKRSVLKAVVKSVVAGAVAKDVMSGLDGFVSLEGNTAVG
ncbi:Exosome complex component rrp42 [Elasticomyces elasticus]|uniref:Ribosomal RNA-processing protein 42 n=1 Tax=Exophiala sideris TaxID=1016849 RepID=A0ABR0JRY6_9EURO|nr:Exosome complex component rrp42 [Elasticomyces elasticus]KAK5040255.1 Exosome complex component rrp42 [Exophiala sideris]KAK5043319.1 Exosome complex component rrp42 [Exophiala sideris]KAK5068633.1 Exosome complex component rrp42 [Exophiala sideris]KAK5186231.1 Exosome complex component rrp42 [Eurotiomycetes sp. CCFEE 6388]